MNNNEQTFRDLHFSSFYLKIWIYSFLILSIFIIILYICKDPEINIPLDTSFMHFDPSLRDSLRSHIPQVPPALFNFD